jgi:hypothetical protein
MRSMAAGLSRASHSPPSDGERLLGREVVGVGLRDVDRQAAGAGGRVDEDEGVALRPAHGDHGAGRGLVVRPRDGVGARVAGRLGGVAGLGADDDRVRQERRALRDRRELLRELAEGQVQRALAHEAGGGGVPEGGRAAVAQDDLVAVGQREELGQAGAHAADELLDGRLAMRGAHQGRARAREVGELLGADLRRPAAEAPVGGLDRGGDLECGAGGVHGRCTVANAPGRAAGGARSPSGPGG